MSNRLDDALRFNQTALNLRAARQELLASNIANADTPNFKARDIDFGNALKQVMSGSNAKLQMAATDSAHLAGNEGKSVMGAPVKYRVATQPSADGNTVDMDVERAQFAENALRYEVSVNLAGMKSVLLSLQG